MTKRQMDARRKALDEFLSETYGDDIVHFGGPEFAPSERKRKKPLDPARGVVIQYGTKA